MTEPNQNKDEDKSDDAGKFNDRLTAELDARGMHASAAALRNEHPDADVTNMGGMSAEKNFNAVTDSHLQTGGGKRK